MACALCRTRRSRRFCPGVAGEICAPCCGAEREATVDCPPGCRYLREARKHEKIVPLDPDGLVNRDIRVPEGLLDANGRLTGLLGYTLAATAFRTRGAADPDAREALEGLVRTYRSLESGVYYDSRPGGPLAAVIFDAAQAAVAALRKREQEEFGAFRTRDADALGVLVFLHRWCLNRNNGRTRGRAFLDALWEVYAAGAGDPPSPASSLILP